MLAAGNKVVFESGNSYIQDRTRTIKTPIEERNGAYVFDIWRPKAPGNQGNMVNTGRHQALMEVEGYGSTEVFSRPFSLMPEVLVTPHPVSLLRGGEFLQALLTGLDGLPNLLLFMQGLLKERWVVFGILFQLGPLHLNECLDVLDVLPPTLDLTLEFVDPLIGRFLLWRHLGFGFGIRGIRLTGIFPARAKPEA